MGILYRSDVECYTQVELEIENIVIVIDKSESIIICLTDITAWYIGSVLWSPSDV